MATIFRTSDVLILSEFRDIGSPNICSLKSPSFAQGYGGQGGEKLKTFHTVINLQTKKKYQFIDLTEQINKIIKESKIQNGIVNIVSRHTTTAVLLNENETLLLSDFKKEIKRLFPYRSESHYYAGDRSRHYYEHDDLERRREICPELSCDECQNAGAHCSSIFLTNSQTVNIVKGRLDLGKWQRILFLELDRDKEREISVMIMGEEKPIPYKHYAGPGPG